MPGGLRTGKVDLAATIEAGFDLECDDATWLTGVLRSVGPALDQGLGVLAFFYDAARPDALAIWGETARGPCGSWRSELRHHLQNLSASQVERVFTRCSRVIATWSEILGASSLQPFTDAKPSGELGARDSVVVRCAELGAWGMIILAPLPHPRRVSPGTASRWARCVADLSAALRIRRRIQAYADGETEAVVTPGGRVSRSEKPTLGQAARELLAQAAGEQGCGPVRRIGSGDAIAKWQALVSGRLSLVDQLDLDRRRWLVARQSSPGLPTLQGLTARERQVVGYLALGQSNKLIGYNLGLSSSSVATLLARAAHKLGAGNRGQLIRALQSLPSEQGSQGVPRLGAGEGDRGHGAIPAELEAWRMGSPGGDYFLFSFSRPTVDWSLLTAAERSVASELLQGASNERIAQSRGTSIRTVANQVASSLHKLGVGSRAELVARSSAAAPIPPPPNSRVSPSSK